MGACGTTLYHSFKGFNYWGTYEEMIYRNERTMLRLEANMADDGRLDWNGYVDELDTKLYFIYAEYGISQTLESYPALIDDYQASASMHYLEGRETGHGIIRGTVMVRECLETLAYNRFYKGATDGRATRRIVKRIAEKAERRYAKTNRWFAAHDRAEAMGIRHARKYAESMIINAMRIKEIARQVVNG